MSPGVVAPPLASLFEWRHVAPRTQPLATGAGPAPLGAWLDTAALAGLRAAGTRLTLGGGRRRASSTLAGPRLTRFRGRGMDFAESRVYLPGDDVRRMDWRVTARTGTAHTKVYEEERARPVIAVVDFGPGMFFGTRAAFKSAVAAAAAALVAWAAVARGDRVGGLLFGAGYHREVRPAAGRRGALALLAALAETGRPPAPGVAPPGQDSDLAAALARARRVARQGGLVFLITDFHHLDTEAERHLARLRERVDVVACRVYDALESSPPPPGRYAVSDGREVALVDTASRVTRAAWQRHFRAARERALAVTRALGVPLVEIATDEDVAGALAAMPGTGKGGARATRG